MKQRIRIQVRVAGHEDGAGRWWINESEKGKLNFRKTQIGADRSRANAFIDIDRDGHADWLHENGNGIAFEKLIDPDGVPDDLFDRLLPVLIEAFEGGRL